MNATLRANSPVDPLAGIDKPQPAEPGSQPRSDPLGEIRKGLIDRLVAEAVNESSTMESILALAAGDAFEMGMRLKAMVSAAQTSRTWEEQQELLPFLITVIRLLHEGGRLVQLKHLIGQVDQPGRPRASRLPSPRGL